jgi:hypothetical protein
MDAPFNNSISLEKQFNSVFLQPFNPYEKCAFKDFRIPNEGSPEGVIEHHQAAVQGTVVIVGSERPFFTACLTDPTKCDGIIVRDIHPKIIAYVNFNILLLRLAFTREEYVNLSRPCTLLSLEGRVDYIKGLLKTRGRDISLAVKSFYKNHLYALAQSYLLIKKSWRTLTAQNFTACRYDLKSHLFNRVQHLAKSGNFMAIQGCITDLEFAKARKISVVDVSNVTDYIFLNFKGLTAETRIIFTYWNQTKTQYFSYMHEELTTDEELQFDHLLRVNLSARKVKLLAIEYESWDCDILNYPVGAFYTRRMLNMLTNFVNSNFIKLSDGNYFHLLDIHSLSKVSRDQIDAICKSNLSEEHLQFLVSSWSYLDMTTYLAFSKVRGWREQFKKQFHGAKELHNFCYKLDYAGLFNEFIDWFGINDLKILKVVNEGYSL